MSLTKSVRLFFPLFLVLAASISGCSDPNDLARINPATGGHSADWLPLAHREAAISDIESCSSCHGKNLSGGITGVSCSSCHLGGPTSVHPAEWDPVYSTHGAYAKSNGTAACANQHCHGTSLGGVAGSGPPCTSCHLGSPTSLHPTDWVPITNTHGPWVKSNNTAACANQYCHGASLGGVAGSGPSCTSCHLGGPASAHPAEWIPVYSTHGPWAKSNNTAACANRSCHGASLDGVADSGPSCTSCHLGGPAKVHPADWIPPVSMHGPYVKLNTTSACANQYCHGLSLTGVANSGPSCTSCHLGGVSSGHPADWTPIYSKHGLYVNANGTGGCSNQTCHGTALAGVSGSGPSCTSCHLGGPTSVHPLDWAPVYSKHGSYVAANGTRACSNQYCHGPLLAGVADSGPSCTSCHMGGVVSIHPASWLGDTCSNHGSYAYTNGTAGCSNISCHGAGLGGVQDSGPSCTKCHAPIPNSNQCNYCHGIPPDGTQYPNIAGKHVQHMQITGVTCMTCHKRQCDQHGNGTLDVVFDPAGPAVAAGNPAPAFDSAAKTCSNIACHIVPAGTFSYYFPDGSGNPVLNTVNIYGNTGGTAPSWYSIGTRCTACHNDPPRNGTDGNNIWHGGYHGGQGPTGPYNQCQLCHPDASSPDNGIGNTITNPLLHRDGIYDVQPEFSSRCLDCH